MSISRPDTKRVHPLDLARMLFLALVHQVGAITAHSTALTMLGRITGVDPTQAGEARDRLGILIEAEEQAMRIGIALLDRFITPQGPKPSSSDVPQALVSMLENLTALDQELESRAIKQGLEEPLPHAEYDFSDAVRGPVLIQTEAGLRINEALFQKIDALKNEADRDDQDEEEG